jgi:glycosyltransferase involved in cell wall biosynthesis
MQRGSMWNGKKVSVVFPAYNEADNIANAVKDFLSEIAADEILVIDNNSSDGTSEKAAKAGAKVITECRQGYGWALRRGLREADGDIIITAEPDGTFVGKDILKLLTYSDEFDVVFGTRTSKDLIWKNAKMNWFLRIGNVFIAKLLEVLFNGPSLSDVGCTLKLIHKDKLRQIISKLQVGGSQFSPEFMIVCIRGNLKCIEIPVNYKERIGNSKITTNNWKSFKLGLVMIWLIIKRRFSF